MTRLSNRQYPVLKIFAEQRSSFGMKIHHAQELDQRPFRSMLIQEWIAYTPIRGFHLTDKGRQAWKEFQHTDIRRKDPTAALTAYFDPTQYELPVGKRLHKVA